MYSVVQVQGHDRLQRKLSVSRMDEKLRQEQRGFETNENLADTLLAELLKKQMVGNPKDHNHRTVDAGAKGL